ncbi:MAG: membrane protein insertion efficiency factor YidD [Opitutaceae bacterium]|nr:membrane protein insertion efficiency factor YidD [Verrucomicrobiales bacterium]
MNPARLFCILLLKFYRRILSPAKWALFGPAGRCRFEPSCSAYALQAVEAHGTLAGSALALKRVCRCHPWGGCGYDPVPRAVPANAPTKPALSPQPNR